jgi:hypothetical protein
LRGAGRSFLGLGAGEEAEVIGFYDGVVEELLGGGMGYLEGIFRGGGIHGEMKGSACAYALDGGFP